MSDVYIPPDDDQQGEWVSVTQMKLDIALEALERIERGDYVNHIHGHTADEIAAEALNQIRGEQ